MHRSFLELWYLRRNVKKINLKRRESLARYNPQFPFPKVETFFRPFRSWPGSTSGSIPKVAVSVNRWVSAQHSAGVYSRTREVIARIPPPYRQATPPCTSVTWWGWLRENHHATCVHAGEICSSENPTQNSMLPCLVFRMVETGSPCVVEWVPLKGGKGVFRCWRRGVREIGNGKRALGMPKIKEASEGDNKDRRIRVVESTTRKDSW
jgi:hypothetical protein